MIICTNWRGPNPSRHKAVAALEALIQTENERNRKRSAPPIGGDDFAEQLKNQFDGLPVSRATQDEMSWQRFTNYLSTFKALNRLMHGAVYDLRAMVLETSGNMTGLERRARQLSGHSSLSNAALPEESGEWPDGHRRLWLRAALVDQANFDVLSFFISQNGPEGVQFLKTHGAPLAVLLCGAETRSAAQAFLHSFNPASLDESVFAPGHESERAFFWYYLVPVYNELRYKRISFPQAGRRLQRWAKSPHTPELWNPKFTDDKRYNVADWLDKDIYSIESSVDQNTGRRIAEYLDEHEIHGGSSWGGNKLLSILSPLALGLFYAWTRVRGIHLDANLMDLIPFSWLSIIITALGLPVFLALRRAKKIGLIHWIPLFHQNCRRGSSGGVSPAPKCPNSKPLGCVPYMQGSLVCTTGWGITVLCCPISQLPKNAPPSKIATPFMGSWTTNSPGP